MGTDRSKLNRFFLSRSLVFLGDVVEDAASGDTNAGSIHACQNGKMTSSREEHSKRSWNFTASVFSMTLHVAFCSYAIENKTEYGSDDKTCLAFLIDERIYETFDDVRLNKYKTPR